MAGLIGEASTSKSGLMPAIAAQSQGFSILDSPSKVSRFTLNLEPGEFAVMLLTVSTTNYKSCSFLILLSKWNIDNVSSATSVGDQSAITSLHYTIENNTYSIYVKPKDSYSSVRASFLSWFGNPVISSSVLTDLPESASSIVII